MKFSLKLFILYILLMFSGRSQVFINEVVSSNQTSLADEDGDYPDWIELFNSGGTSINLSGYGITDDYEEPFKWVFPNVEIESGDYLILFASDKDRTDPVNLLHTNFKISASGEKIVLTKPSWAKEDSIFVPSLTTDISYGRQPDGSNQFYLFDITTPGASNTSSGFLGIANNVEFSQQGGFYSSSINLNLSTSDPSEMIYYTIDGSTPSTNSNLFSGTILLDSTTVVRAQASAPGKIDGSIITQTYFMNEPQMLPVLSLSTDPENLWSDSAGIYVMGPNADTSNYPYWGANFWEDWERPAHIEFFDEFQNLGFSIDAGVKIFGSWSRLYPQKSLAVFARGIYGFNEVDYELFPDKDIDVYQSFVMRNSGQDWGRTFFRDALIQSLAEGADVDVQAYRPALVYFNGDFMGIFNLREKMSEHYIESNHGFDSNDIDMIERDTSLVHGDFTHFHNFIQFLETHSLQTQADYDSVKNLIDIESFIDYLIIRCFSATSDWPWNNVKMWRPRSADGKWRWLLYDTDYGFHGGHLGPSTNMFTEISNQDTRTSFITAKLFENEEFVFNFVSRYADRLNTILKPDALLNRISNFKSFISAAMPYHIEKWKYSFNEVWWLGKSIDSMNEWDSNIQIAGQFAQTRADFVRQNLTSQFSQYISGTASLILYPPGEGGKIKVNSILVDNYPWSGKYFEGIRVRLEAVPNDGYQFIRWIGNNIPQTNPLELQITDGQVVSAEFSPMPSVEPPLVINEINYNSTSTFDPGDWVEFYNNTDSTIDLSSYEFKDENDDHIFKFSNGTFLGSNDYVVLYKDSANFAASFPNVTNCLGEIDFGLSGGGELLRLFDPQGNIVDSLTYDDKEPWPTSPDGDGPTLSLKNPSLDNSFASSWKASLGFGTPGGINDVFTNTEKDFNIVKNFMLFQNYPNPFNPVTEIRFQIPDAALVKLIIFNILGEKVKLIVNENLNSGIHSYKWNSRNDRGNKVPSGVYFYSIFTDGKMKSSKKMILLR